MITFAKIFTMPLRSQAEILALFIPVLADESPVFRKKKNVFAKKAKDGEVVATRTNDGLETVNTASEGDFLVKNQTEAAELYLIKADKFHQRYVWLRPADDGFEEYAPTGRARAVELTEERLKTLGLDTEFHFEAPWKEDMIAEPGDFMVSPLDLSEVYRIARKEFLETYEVEGQGAKGKEQTGNQ